MPGNKATKKATKKTQKGVKKGWNKALLTDETKCLTQTYSVSHSRKNLCAEIKVYRQAQNKVCGHIVDAIAKVPTGAWKYDEETAKEVTILAFKGKKRLPDDVYEALPEKGTIMRDHTPFRSITPLIRSGMQEKWYDSELDKLAKEEGINVKESTCIFWKAYRNTKRIEKEYRRKLKAARAKGKGTSESASGNLSSDDTYDFGDDDDEEDDDWDYDSLDETSDDGNQKPPGRKLPPVASKPRSKDPPDAESAGLGKRKAPVVSPQEPAKKGFFGGWF